MTSRLSRNIVSIPMENTNHPQVQLSSQFSFKVQHLNLDAVITDFSPLREAVACVETVKGALPQDVPFFQVS